MLCKGRKTLSIACQSLKECGYRLITLQLNTTVFPMFSSTSNLNRASSKSTFYGKMVDAAHKISVSVMAVLVLHILMFATMCFN